MLHIAYLADHPEAIPSLAQGFKQEWGDYYADRSIEEIEEYFRQQANREAMPIALVAFEDGVVRGTVALASESITTHPHLSPWLAAFFVEPGHRGRGIGTELIRAGMDEAQRLGFDRLYGGTATSESLLTRLGWELIEVSPYHGEACAVMVYSFADDEAGTDAASESA